MNAEDVAMIMDELRHRYRRTPPLSLEGSREVLEEMANPPKDTPERRRTFERVRMIRAFRNRLARQDARGAGMDASRTHPTEGAVRLQVTDAGVLIPREMLPNVQEVDVRQEGGVMVLVPLPDPNDPIWELGNEAVACGLPDGSENHDRYIYGTDS